MMFLDCPAYLDDEHAVRCGLPAEVRRRFNLRSTDGLLESAMIRCPAGHWFNGPIEFLTWDRRAVPAGLSDREAQVLTLLARGHSNRQIASQPEITPQPTG